MAGITVDQSSARTIQLLVSEAYPAAGDAVGRDAERYLAEVKRRWPKDSGESAAGFRLVYRVQGDVYNVALNNSVTYANAVPLPSGERAASTIVFGAGMERLEKALVIDVPKAIVGATDG